VDASNPAPFIKRVEFLWVGARTAPQYVRTQRVGDCDGFGQCPSGYFCAQGNFCRVEKFDPDRVSVVHGVVTASGTPLPGVTVSAVSDEEYGYVKTEWASGSPASGRYFMAVNAGGPVRLRFARTGYLPAERVVSPVAGQYVLVAPTELVPEQAGTLVTPGSSNWQVVAGATEFDTGTRTARLFFQPSTNWSPAGSCSGTPNPCSSYATEPPCSAAGCRWTGTCGGTPRACSEKTDQSSCTAHGCSWNNGTEFSVKEYTVGATGTARMPAELPPASAYTYAIEARAKNGGVSISPTFDKHVIIYQEDFLPQGGLPVGWTVPSGNYDPVAGQWTQHRDGSTALNGRIIKICGYTSNAADIDWDGVGGECASIENGELTLGERQTLWSQYSTAYPTGVKLWRVPVKHFSTFDFNYGWGLPSGATAPLPEISNEDVDCPAITSGSIIECETQVLGEEIEIPGTPYRLVYRSSRAPGYQSARRVTVVLPLSSLPSSAVDARAVFSAGGEEQTQVVPKPGGGWTAPVTFEFVWNGTDSFGRPVNGRTMATALVGLTYQGSYEPTAEFGLPAGASSASGYPTREQVTIWKEWNGYIGALNARRIGFGGWTISEHHAYSLDGQAIYFGSGGMRRAEALGDVTRVFAGKKIGLNECVQGTSPCGEPYGMSFGADGKLYVAYPAPFSSSQDGQIRAIAPDGSLTIPIDANQGLYGPSDVSVAADGTLYIADHWAHSIFKWNAGTLTTVVGTGTWGDGGEGLGTTIDLDGPTGVAVAPDGSVYMSDTYNHKIRRLDASGYVTTFAGNGTQGYAGDGGPATAASIHTPVGIAAMGDGSVCFANYADSPTGRVRCVDPAGIIRTVAGGGTASEDSEGVAATSVKLEWPARLARGLDGSLYVSQEHRVRRIAPNGVITTVAGNFVASGCTGEGVGALTARFDTIWGLALDAKNQLYVSDVPCQNVRRITPAVLGHDADQLGQIAVPSADARELYVFDGAGRHLRTEDAHSGTVRFAFEYTNYQVSPGVYEARLSAIRDKRGSTAAQNDLVTFFDYDSAGQATWIASPEAGYTSFTVTNGNLVGVTFPDSLGSYTLGYQTSTNGLLTSLLDPKGGQHVYEYTTDGRLSADRDPATLTGNAFRTLSRTVQHSAGSRTTTVSVTTASNLTTQYSRVQAASGSTTSTVTKPDGTATSSVKDAAGAVTSTLPDGTTRQFVPSVDPRFGAAAPTGTNTLTLAGTSPKKQLITRTERTITGGSGLQDFTTLTETRKTFKNAADAQSGTPALTHTSEVNKAGSPHFLRETTPAGRKTKRELDTYGRVVKVLQDYASPEFSPVEISYDNSGRITLIKQGTTPNDRQTELVWDWTGNLQYEKRGTAANPSLFVTEYVTDARGRVREIFRNTSGVPYTQFKLGYDGNSNVTSVDIPTGAAFRQHLLPHLGTNLLGQYDPPNVSGVSPDVVDYDYDKDRRLKLVDWATTGMGIDLVYDQTPGKLHQKKKLGTSTVLATHAYGSSGAANGKPTTVTAGDITTTYTYAGVQSGWDGLLFKLGTSWSASTKEVTFTYDDFLRVQSETVTGGQAIQYLYDGDSLTTSVTVGSLGTITVGRSTKSGRVESLTGGVVTTTFGYADTTFGGLTSIGTICTGTTCTQTANCGTSGNCFTESLSYDALGRIATRTDTVKSSAQPQITYTYDGQSRLWKATPLGGTVTEYLYDETGNRNGNRTKADFPGTAWDLSLTYDEQDRISSAWWLHDADGRRTFNPLGDDDEYVYDDFGRLTQAIANTGLEVHYTYDGLGRRVTRKQYQDSQLEVERRYLYAQGNRLIAVYDGSGTLRQQFVYASGSHTPDAVVLNNTTLYRIVQDHLGSLRMVVRASDGAVVQRMDFDEWGRLKVLNLVVADVIPFGFAGGLRDSDTNLVQMGARWYDPMTGRFITKDPVRFTGGFNLYAYAYNDPVNFIDPTGLDGLQIPPGTFDWFWKLFELKDDADRAANLMYPDDMHNGRGDAFKHCLASCEAAQIGSTWASALLGWGNEKYGNWYGQPIEEEQMDHRNNACGRLYSDRIDQRRQSHPADPANHCWNKCWAGVLEQDLVYGIESPGYSGKNPYF
jgi:RHS repeat-associated protein